MLRICDADTGYMCETYVPDEQRDWQVVGLGYQKLARVARVASAAVCLERGGNGRAV